LKSIAAYGLQFNFGQAVLLDDLMIVNVLDSTQSGAVSFEYFLVRCESLIQTINSVDGTLLTQSLLFVLGHIFINYYDIAIGLHARLSVT
jgi:hypothetical protein